MSLRIQLTDSLQDAIAKMVEGNVGAVTVCAELVKKEAKIDPDAALAPIDSLLALDDLGIYGSKIWMLYKDVCGEDIVNTRAVLRARQLGILSEDVLLNAIDKYGDGIDCDDILAKVQERLPAFGHVEGDV